MHVCSWIVCTLECGVCLDVRVGKASAIVVPSRADGVNVPAGWTGFGAFGGLQQVLPHFIVHFLTTAGQCVR